MKNSSIIWHPYSPGISGNELHVSHGNGAYLYLKDGRKILDGISSWWVNIHGHAHPYIANAIGNQAQKLEQVIFSGFTHEPAETLAERLISKLPGDFSRIFYSDNGSTAVEVALKMALQHFYLLGKPRKKIVALSNAYHGDTFGTMAVGEKGLFTNVFREFLFDVSSINPPYSQSIDTEENDEWEPSLQSAELLFKTEKVAALVVEPLLQGSGGMRIFPKGWLTKLYALARKYGTLIISDEVFTGFYRTGKMFAGDSVSEKADIVCLSKGLTAGFLPMGITACTALVAKPFENDDASSTFYHGHSFTANPLACAAALASLDLTEDPGFEHHISEISHQQAAFVTRVMRLFPETSPRSIGTIMALNAGEGSYSYTHPIRKKVFPYFLNKGLLLRPLGNVIYTVPPYCINNEELNYVQEAILDFLAEHQNME